MSDAWIRPSWYAKDFMDIYVTPYNRQSTKRTLSRCLKKIFCNNQLVEQRRQWHRDRVQVNVWLQNLKLIKSEPFATMRQSQLQPKDLYQLHLHLEKLNLRVKVRRVFKVWSHKKTNMLNSAHLAVLRHLTLLANISYDDVGRVAVEREQFINKIRTGQKYVEGI